MIFRTDLAKEACDGINSIDGLESSEFVSFGVRGNRVKIKSERLGKEIGKSKGEYVSFESDAVILHNTDEYGNISNALAEEIKKMLKGTEGSILVAGLGNENMTADSLGPKTVKNVLVTKHIFDYIPNAVDGHMRNVCAVSPGVMGVTGIESADIIKGICSFCDIQGIIAVDALAARKSERMFSTFQICDAGIEPGAGVGNGRSALNREKLGIPVIAIGVPTVIYASSLVFDTAEEILKSVTDMSDEEIQKAVFGKIRYKTGDTVVTPKDVDVISSDSAKIVADAINLAMHRGMSKEDISAYMA